MAAGSRSIKGSVFGAVVEDVNKTLQGGRITRAELGRWLDEQDLALLDASVNVASWYPITAYAHMNELLRDVEGHGRNEYLRELGRETARRLLGAGLYSQLEYVQRTQLRASQSQAERFAAFGRDLTRLVTISSSILDFSSWAREVDPEHADRYRIVVSDAEDFPEVLAWRSDGFVNEMATTHGDPDLWGWKRVARDRIEFRMLRPV